MSRSERKNKGGRAVAVSFGSHEPTRQLEAVQRLALVTILCSQLRASLRLFCAQQCTFGSSVSVYGERHLNSQACTSSWRISDLASSFASSSIGPHRAGARIDRPRYRAGALMEPSVVLSHRSKLGGRASRALRSCHSWSVEGGFPTQSGVRVELAISWTHLCTEPGSRENPKRPRPQKGRGRRQKPLRSSGWQRGLRAISASHPQ